MILGKFKVRGHSMEPYLKEGDTVIVSSMVGIKRGNVVVFRYGPKYLIKRITKIKGNAVSVLGDNADDNLKVGVVNRKDIIGKVLFKI